MTQIEFFQFPGTRLGRQKLPKVPKVVHADRVDLDSIATYIKDDTQEDDIVETDEFVSIKFTKDQIVVIPRSNLVTVGNKIDYKLIYSWAQYYDPKIKKYCLKYSEELVDIGEIEYRKLMYRFCSIPEQAL